MRPIVEIIAENPSADIHDTIDTALTAFNAEMRGLAPETPDFAVVLRDPQTNTVIGGLYGTDDYGWTYIKFLLVPESCRGMGLGAQLLSTAEEIAQKRGSIGVWLGTFAFQARAFYEKQGYVLFGELEGDGGAVPLYFMKKRLR
jgi:GNAT superfamily N-acetyltransferase